MQPIQDTPTLKDALHQALQEGRAMKADLLQRQDMLTLEQMALLLQRSEVDVLQASYRGEVLGLEADQQLRFPAWQVGRGRTPLNGLQEIIEIAGSAWQAYHYLLSRPKDLDYAHAWQALDDGWRTQIICQIRQSRGER